MQRNRGGFKACPCLGKVARTKAESRSPRAHTLLSPSPADLRRSLQPLAAAESKLRASGFCREDSYLRSMRSLAPTARGPWTKATLISLFLYTNGSQPVRPSDRTLRLHVEAGARSSGPRSALRPAARVHPGGRALCLRPWGGAHPPRPAHPPSRASLAGPVAPVAGPGVWSLGAGRAMCILCVAAAGVAAAAEPIGAWGIGFCCWRVCKRAWPQSEEMPRWQGSPGRRTLGG